MAWLDTFAVTIAPGATTWVATVPGDRLWMIRTVYTVAVLDAGGSPNRSYTLTVATSTGPVSVVGAPNAVGDSGTDKITWANAPSASIAAGGVGVVVAAFVVPTLWPGYTLTGTIAGAVGTDHWTTARVWYDYALTSGL